MITLRIEAEGDTSDLAGHGFRFHRHARFARGPVRGTTNFIDGQAPEFCHPEPLFD